MQSRTNHPDLDFRGQEKMSPSLSHARTSGKGKVSSTGPVPGPALASASASRNESNVEMETAISTKQTTCIIFDYNRNGGVHDGIFHGGSHGQAQTQTQTRATIGNSSQGEQVSGHIRRIDDNSSTTRSHTPKQRADQYNHNHRRNQQQLDFIGPATAVKDLFALPFSNDVNVAVAVHNLGNGTLLIDGAVVGEAGDASSGNGNVDGNNTDASNANASRHRGTRRRRGRRRPRPYSCEYEKDPTQKLPPTPTKRGMNLYPGQRYGHGQQDNLKDFVSNMLEMQRKYLHGSPTTATTTDATSMSKDLNDDGTRHSLPLPQSLNFEDDASPEVTPGSVSKAIVAKVPSAIKGFQNENENQNLLLDHIIPKPDTYTNTNDTNGMNDDNRTYHKWQFGRYNMLVGSDAVILNNHGESSNDSVGGSYSNDNCITVNEGNQCVATTDQDGKSSSTCTTLSVRIADVDQLRSRLDQREQDIRAARQSYAEALSLNQNKRNHNREGQRQNRRNDTIAAVEDQSNCITTGKSSDIVTKRIEYPDFSRMAIQSCVLPSCDFQWQMQKHGFTARQVPDTSIHITGEGGESNDGSQQQGAPSSSPVCMVLDAYLDNIITNVPQLALCLQKKGLIQAIKLFDTEDLPTLSSDLLENTSDSNTDEHALSGTRGNQRRAGLTSAEPLFSPQIVESNANMLLEFLKTNCDKENSTYLLQRNAGETSVRLLDVTTLSRQRHRKWIYWLAMMSLRFALRLEGLSMRASVGITISDDEVKRDYRRKKRGLLENALELLHELTDMDGGKFETICTGIYEQLADLFLEQSNTAESEKKHEKATAFDSFSCSFLKSGAGSVNASISTQLYDNVSCDALSRAQDLLMKGIKELEPALTSAFHNQKVNGIDDDTGTTLEVEAVFLQMYGIYHKLTNVTLCLAEKSLLLYKSSSVMQALRLTSRVISDSAALLIKVGINQASSEGDCNVLGHHVKDFVCSLAYQFSHLYKACGDLTRSFAADEAMRERGHACGDDLISLLQDVELSSTVTKRIVKMASISTARSHCRIHSITLKTQGVLTLNYLSGILPLSDEGTLLKSRMDSKVEKANSFLRRQKQLKRDKRRVLVAAVICYSQAAEIFDLNVEPSVEKSSAHSSTLHLMLQRYGDACNEVGKILLDELRGVMRTSSFSLPIATSFLLSAEHWFKEGLRNFELCDDATNVALLRCNLCQCCKVRSNATALSLPRMAFTGRQDDGEKNLDIDNIKDAARHLELAHEVLCQREDNPSAWDMVSSELAATYLILGVKRRNILIGVGSSPLALRLSPGDERSITEPLERAKSIFESLGDQRQAATSRYHLAVYYSKVWTCQRDEARTKEKLSLCFHEFGLAHNFFFSNMRLNEYTFVCLILDLSHLYSTVSFSSEYECQEKALLCCLDSCDAFSPSTIHARAGTETKSTPSKESSFAEWLRKMTDLNEKMEKRILSLLSTLVRLEKKARMPSKYEDLYRDVLRLKISRNCQASNAAEELSAFAFLQLMRSTLGSRGKTNEG